MKDQQGSNRISSGAIAAVSAVVVAVGGGVAWFTTQSSNTPTPSNPSGQIAQPAQPSTRQPANEQTPNVYWLTSKDKNVALVPQPVKVASILPNQPL